jgi:ATP-dependent DNA helicase RecG
MNRFESQHTEWKESWRDDLLRWVCGFANAEGGRLEIGRNDKGEIVGLANAPKLLEDLPNKIRDLLGILVAVNLHHTDGKAWLVIEVDAYLNPISYRGHYYIRSGSTLQEIKGSSLDRFLLRKQGRTWDGVPVPKVKTGDLSAPAIRKFREMAARSGRLDPADLRVSDAALIEKLKLTEGDYLKRAALLLFHEDPERFVTGAFVKIGYFRSASDLAYHDEVHGNLFEQTAQTIDLVRTKYLKAAITYQGIQRIERYPVPNAALREAILNALVHRDYAVGAPVQIRVYENRLKIWNPAVLPEGWTLENLLADHASTPYNPFLANAFFRAGEIETWGRGIQRIFEACQEAGTPTPIIDYKPNDLWIEFPFSPEYLKAIATTSQSNAQGGVESGVESGAESPMTSQILGFLAGESLSKAEIARKLGKAKPSRYLNDLMAKLILADQVEYTLPNKPNSRLQKYRLTENGRAWLSRNQP